MANELTVAEKLKQLYLLQQIDSELDQIKILKGELPMEVSDLEDEVAGLETRVNKLTSAVDDIQSDIDKRNAAIFEANTLIDRYNKQMDAVKNNREYEALQKEIELQQLEIQLGEKKIREARVALELKQETKAASLNRLELKTKELATKRDELAQIIEKTEKDEERLTKKSDKARKNIEERLLKPYDKIRKAYRNGLSVATVLRDACGGCFNYIPPQMQLEIAMRKKIMACEHCGRILVDEAIETVGTEVAAN